jgi:hypothetical protein
MSRRPTAPKKISTSEAVTLSLVVAGHTDEYTLRDNSLPPFASSPHLFRGLLEETDSIKY